MLIQENKHFEQFVSFVKKYSRAFDIFTIFVAITTGTIAWYLTNYFLAAFGWYCFAGAVWIRMQDTELKSRLDTLQQRANELNRFAEKQQERIEDHIGSITSTNPKNKEVH